MRFRSWFSPSFAQPQPLFSLRHHPATGSRVPAVMSNSDVQRRFAPVLMLHRATTAELQRWHFSQQCANFPSSRLNSWRQMCKNFKTLNQPSARIIISIDHAPFRFSLFTFHSALSTTSRRSTAPVIRRRKLGSAGGTWLAWCRHDVRWPPAFSLPHGDADPPFSRTIAIQSGGTFNWQ